MATYLAGDFNRDGHVDAADVLPMEQALADLADYEAAKGLTTAQMLLVGDVNGDGVVTGADLQALLNLLKSGGGSNNSVPEPSTLVLAVLAFGTMGEEKGTFYFFIFLGRPCGATMILGRAAWRFARSRARCRTERRGPSSVAAPPAPARSEAR